MKNSTSGGKRMAAPKVTNRGRQIARKAMMATSGRKGRLTGYKEATNLGYNRSAVANKARKVDAATSVSKKVKPASKRVSTSSVTGKNTVKGVSRAQQKRTLDMVSTAATLIPGAGIAAGGARALKAASAINKAAPGIKQFGTALKYVSKNGSPQQFSGAIRSYRNTMNRAEGLQRRGLLSSSEVQAKGRESLNKSAAKISKSRGKKK